MTVQAISVTKTLKPGIVDVLVIDFFQEIRMLSNITTLPVSIISVTANSAGAGVTSFNLTGTIVTVNFNQNLAGTEFILSIKLAFEV